ncbi:ABC transporter ATP-binding protein [Acaryochloris sp. IP29b_bin.148]|uniref:ABC transporter ATP-binding protein n=1 Tax=Acaryochloris sp. IP29b_bin.148 TaxID=2969218 RepID=UPI0026070317|nr:ABC transporter ATP-binding protein [Acaryochloris sp. IP29b_bin.148]
MSDTVIRVENLGKKYLLRHQQEGSTRYKALRDVLAEGAKSVGRGLNPLYNGSLNKPSKEEFWALKDVSFEIKQGDRVGIIGRNGAGKSTLLKILSRITEPTTGRISIKGRVASLLEVGTGFHPELTGRENIFLNGAVLGMGKSEIKRKFDEIVAFAEVEKFLDTPVKRYSSGMYVRLAFAVAAHLELQILIVDEVLAVGDAQFQKKCLGKMEEAGKDGKTVLFVSHNMAAIEKLCQKGILLHQGKINYIGSQTESITKYLANCSSITNSLQERTDRRGTGQVRVNKIEIRDELKNSIDTAISGQTIEICFCFKVPQGFLYRGVIASFVVKTQLDIPVFLQHNRLTCDEFGQLPEEGVFVCQIPHLPLPEHTYEISYSLLKDGQYLDAINNAIQLNVVGGGFYDSGEIPPISHGLCLVDAKWSLESTSNKNLDNLRVKEN